MRYGVVLLVAAGIPGCALAAEADPCARVTAQQDMNACIGDAVNRADAVLNRVYRQLNDKLDVNGKRNLVAAERAWITFRDRECELRTGYDTRDLRNNGTIAPYLVGQCKLDLTSRRTEELRTQIRCPGGDLSCSE
jgi:uncharacterized protein YecT (DUF1311 family)